MGVYLSKEERRRREKRDMYFHVAHDRKDGTGLGQGRDPTGKV